MNVRIDGIIHCRHKAWEVDVKSIVVTNETTPIHLTMRSKRVEGHPKGWNMKYISNSNHMPIQHNLDGPNAGDGSFVAIRKSDVFGRQGLVGCERGVVWPHVVGGTRVGNHDGRQIGMGGSNMGGGADAE